MHAKLMLNLSKHPQYSRHEAIPRRSEERDMRSTGAKKHILAISYERTFAHGKKWLLKPHSFIFHPQLAPRKSFHKSVEWVLNFSSLDLRLFEQWPHSLSTIALFQRRTPISQHANIQTRSWRPAPPSSVIFCDFHKSFEWVLNFSSFNLTLFREVTAL